MREKIAALPGDKHWQMLAKSAMQDDLSGLQRTLTGNVLASGGEGNAKGATGGTSPAKLVAAWQDANRRALERAEQLLVELRAVPAPDAAMLSVALRELRSLA